MRRCTNTPPTSSLQVPTYTRPRANAASETCRKGGVKVSVNEGVKGRVNGMFMVINRMKEIRRIRWVD